MIVLLLHLLGFGWFIMTWGYVALHVSCAIGALLMLGSKGYLRGGRGVVIGVVAFLDWGAGIFNGLLLPDLTEKPA